jgi:hypothetical protein
VSNFLIGSCAIALVILEISRGTCSWKLTHTFGLQSRSPRPHLAPVHGCVRMLVDMQNVWMHVDFATGMRSHVLMSW